MKSASYLSKSEEMLVCRLVKANQSDPPRETERQRGKERDRETERQRDRDAKRETERQRDRETDRETERQTQ